MDILDLSNLRLCVTVLDMSDKLSDIEKVYEENRKPSETVISTFLRLAREKVERNKR